MDTVLVRYGSAFLERPFQDFYDMIPTAMEEQDKERWYQWWVRAETLRLALAGGEFIPFMTFYQKLYGKTRDGQVIEPDTRTAADIIAHFEALDASLRQAPKRVETSNDIPV